MDQGQDVMNLGSGLGRDRPSTGPAGGGSETRRASVGGPPVTAALAKSKRVRTGCLTCRERHLKCDEGTPDCLNCRKSSRECKRGVRLNFIDIKVETPPFNPSPVGWTVQFQDESRLIASEYRGGLGRYAHLDEATVTPPRETDVEARPRHQRPGTMEAPSSQFTDSGNRAMQFSTTQGMYYGGSISRPAQEQQQQQQQQFSSYEDQLTSPYSRKNSDAFLGVASGPTPTSTHSGGGGGAGGGGGGTGTGFNLGMGYDRYSMEDEPDTRPTHGYKSSNASSVASSLVPQGVAPSSSASFRHGAGSGAPNPHEGLMTPPSEKTNGERDYLNSAEEIHYMQRFIEEVAVWMDSLDHQKHFSRVIPYLALKSPMLLNAFLACGVKHLTLVDNSYKDDKALFYYDTATTQLLRSLQNPDRNMAECATTAVVLNVYEIMSEKPTARMSHIAGARALIRECGWNAKTTGIGAACFWLNIGMEVLSCLAFNWQTAWDPDQWGLDPEELMNMGEPTTNKSSLSNVNTNDGNDGDGDGNGMNALSSMGIGEEEIWVHRIFYIVAKVANFRANIPKFQEPSPHDEQVRLQSRFTEWNRLKGLCDSWNNNCPRPMRPYGYLLPSSNNQSAFPNVWLIKRAAIVGRLFYHTAMCLLAQINPLKSRETDENKAAQLHHAHQVCGIVAHTKDHGVASVAIRSLAIAASVLTEPREQKEVMGILNKIHKETAWKLDGIMIELKHTWGWSAGSIAGGGGGGLPAPGQSAAAAAAAQQAQLPGTSGAAVVNQFFSSQPSSQRPSPRPSPQLQQQQYNHYTSYHQTHQTHQQRPQQHAQHHQQNQQQQQHQHQHQHHQQQQQQQQAQRRASSVHTVAPMTSNASSPSMAPTPVSAATTKPTVNPLLSHADFTLPNHPYQNWYKPPNGTNAFSSHGLWPY